MALIKNLVTNRRDTIWNNKRGQSAAPKESFVPNCSDIVWNNNRSQSATPRKGAVPNCSDAVWNNCVATSSYEFIRGSLNYGIAVVATIIYFVLFVYSNR